ncbi:hypothetical protein BH10PAT4_BH10PAT4_3040 [soil metagenome]
MPKASTIGIYASVFAVIVAVVAVGYHAPQETSGVANASPVTTQSDAQPTSVDQVVATTVAAQLAESTNLSIAPNIAESAVTAQTQSQFLQSADTTVITKPQIVQPVSDNRTVIDYAVVSDDTVDSVAAKYGISADTLKWANNLTSSTLRVGTTLTILPTNGVLYTVKSGDTLGSISEKYGVDQTRVVLYNDLDVSGITSGQRLVLPGANLPTIERPGYVAPITYFTGYSSGFSGGKTWNIKSGTPGYAGNTYAYGNCTRYAYDRRVELGLPVSANWGNAGTWGVLASRVNGLTVDRSPSAGAIIQDSGHVAIVEEVLPNGDLRLSEMNAYVSGGGWNKVSGRILPAASVGQYLFIH